MIMKVPSFLLSCIIAFFCFSCNNGTSVTSDETNTEELCTPDFTKSLEFWTDDTIIKLNPKLVQIMDTLYQYVNQELFYNGLNDNIIWMNNYRNTLCNYYRETRQIDSISDYAMADSIIVEANILWDVHKDNSTMGMIVSNDTELTRLIFQQYNEFEKLNSICKTEGQRAMLRTEFAEWIKLEDLFYRIFANCVDLHYWGGSIRGPIKTRGALDILQSHIDLYKKEYSILTIQDKEWNDYGTFIKSAQDLLISCCKQALIEYYYADETDIRFKELYRMTYQDTKILISKLPEYIDAWCKSRKPWEEEVCTDWLRSEYPRHTSEVLLRLAHIISSVQ